MVSDTGESRTYKELDENSTTLARALHDAGLRRGDVVASLTDNAVEAFEVCWATKQSGLYQTTINYHLKADEVAYIVQDSDAKAFIVSATLSTTAAATLGALPNICCLLAFGGIVDGFGSYETACG